MATNTIVNTPVRTQGSTVVEFNSIGEVVDWINSNDKRGRISQTAVMVEAFIESNQKCLPQIVQGFANNKTPAEQAASITLNIKNHLRKNKLDSIKVVKRGSTYTMFNLDRLNQQEKTLVASLR